ncbi:uncharacterized protein LOC128161252 [Crassostrea angulata]|uniref:uncharacterized protein LOC128161252 n=1 Tax=Magallana angulata TaxID=2784310 RepID=UPI0022B14226|nr:uncharacterized protein LOC128161252 [Crassostrea angulata]
MGVRLDYWFSINVSILIILTLTLTETSCDSKKGKTPFKCYQEPVWNETSKNCSGCKPGYYGSYCSQSCKYPSFGAGCQQRCTCREEQCDFSNGCSNKTTTMFVITSILMSAMDKTTGEMDNKTVEMEKNTVEMDSKTAEMDSKTVEMDNKTVEMDNKTVEISKPKETLFHGILSTLFNTNNMSIMIVSVVGLILITLMFVFAYKLIRKKCSQRRILNCHNKENLPGDSMHEPVHYEEILNITVLSTVEGHESVNQSDND